MSFQAWERVEKNSVGFFQEPLGEGDGPSRDDGRSTQSWLGWGCEPGLTHGAVNTIHAQGGLSLWTPALKPSPVELESTHQDLWYRWIKKSQSGS